MGNTTSVNWKSELNATAFKYHVLVAWVAVILNPLWAIGDYFNIPAHFVDFFIVRIFFSTCTLVGVLWKKKLSERPEIIALIPFVGLSIQNAYMCSVMTIPEIHVHVFATIVLFVGAGMFVLWQLRYSIIVTVIWFIVNIILFKLNSPFSYVTILINGGLLTISVVLFTILLINTRTNLTKKEIIARLALAESNKQLAEKSQIIAEKNKDINDSINYAKRIQHAILPAQEDLKEMVEDSFLLFEPKDIVSGDFYWFSKKGDTVFFAAADCTGHGVPGALMSMIGCSFLNEIVNERHIEKPSEILDALRISIIKTLKTKGAEADQPRDGMDIALCAINFKENKFQYAGAFNPLWMVREGKLIEIKADKFPIGNYIAEQNPFTNHETVIKKGDAIYLFSDGYADQFGGPKGKKFKYKQLEELLLSIQSKSMEEQKLCLKETFQHWKGDLVQIDDVLIMGVRI